MRILDKTFKQTLFIGFMFFCYDYFLLNLLYDISLMWGSNNSGFEVYYNALTKKLLAPEHILIEPLVALLLVSAGAIFALRVRRMKNNVDGV
ncbi:hypothetical protein [Sulfurirhabdus autotrophica]|uniref:Uncharacterized protein n=1 Tax=Sulfurirhabdus autotrophica TaxID=1706046 RepID=A0A4R3Y729_9PROT|nr:hypothetical protein [Sulfurirhabdus autotrophica]TCV86314.1 hypothetical protein EDC63_1071 [Sulfurirhabdus autotrophica]